MSPVFLLAKASPVGVGDKWGVLDSGCGPDHSGLLSLHPAGFVTGPQSPQLRLWKLGHVSEEEYKRTVCEPGRTEPKGQGTE